MVVTEALQYSSHQSVRRTALQLCRTQSKKQNNHVQHIVLNESASCVHAHAITSSVTISSDSNSSCAELALSFNTA